MQKPELEKLQLALTELEKILIPVYEKIKDFEVLSHRTSEEEEELKKLQEVVKEAFPLISTAVDIFGNQAFISTVAYYNGLKQQAEKGDQVAQKIIKGLAPLYEKALLSQIDLN